jgi:hypothetical protein
LCCQLYETDLEVAAGEQFSWVDREINATLVHATRRKVSVDIYVSRDTKKEASAELGDLKGMKNVASASEDSESEATINGVTIHVSG